MMTFYDAFISYSHAKDKPLASTLQRSIQKLGKPWYRRRAVRIFRDDTSLSATPHLWPTIEQALSQSRFFILIASPEAAASQWVNKEVAYWLEHKSTETLLIGITDGELSWDHNALDFTHHDRTPLPPVLARRFSIEPKWVDLRPYREQSSAPDAKFIDLAADFAAAIRGIPKEDLISDELRQQRRALTQAWSAAGLLLVLAGLAGWQWKLAVDAERVANEQRELAQKQRDRAETNYSVAKDATVGMTNGLRSLKDLKGSNLDIVRSILQNASGSIDAMLRVNPDDMQTNMLKSRALGEFLEIYFKQRDYESMVRVANERLHFLTDLREETGASYEARANTFAMLAQAHQGMHNLPEALKSIASAIEMRKTLAGENKGRPVYNSLRAGVASVLTTGAWIAADADEAELRKRYLDEALGILRELIDADPENANFGKEFWVATEQLGEDRRVVRDFSGALEIFQQGLQVANSWAKRQPDNVVWYRFQAGSLGHIAGMKVLMGDSEGAIHPAREAVEIARNLVRNDVQNASWRRFLSAALIHLGQAYAAAHDLDSAAKALDECITLRKDVLSKNPTNKEVQFDVGYALFVKSQILTGSDKIDLLKQALVSFESMGETTPNTTHMIALIKKQLGT